MDSKIQEMTLLFTFYFTNNDQQSQFSVEDATATISSGAISERTRKLKEEQEALRQKHATERQDTDLPLISAEMARMVRWLLRRAPAVCSLDAAGCVCRCSLSLSEMARMVRWLLRPCVVPDAWGEKLFVLCRAWLEELLL